MKIQKESSAVGGFLQFVLAVLCAVAFTFGLFLVLPLMQTISSPPPDDLLLQSAAVVNLPPPPTEMIEPEPEEQEEVEEPPELIEEAQPLDLSQLELAMNPGVGGLGAGDFAVDVINQLEGEKGSQAIDEVFSMSDLDQKPRILFQRPPNYPSDLRKAGRKGTVVITFMVDKRGRVSNPKVERSTDPAFEKAALDAVKQWRFEPGQRKGEKVSFKMRIPITFNAG